MPIPNRNKEEKHAFKKHQTIIRAGLALLLFGGALLTGGIIAGVIAGSAAASIPLVVIGIVITIAAFVMGKRGATARGKVLRKSDNPNRLKRNHVNVTGTTNIVKKQMTYSISPHIPQTLANTRKKNVGYKNHKNTKKSKNPLWINPVFNFLNSKKQTSGKDQTKETMGRPITERQSPQAQTTSPP